MSLDIQFSRECRCTQEFSGWIKENYSRKSTWLFQKTGKNVRWGVRNEGDRAEEEAKAWACDVTLCHCKELEFAWIKNKNKQRKNQDPTICWT